MGQRVDRIVRLGYRLAYLGLRAWWLVRRPATHGAGVALWRKGKVLLVRTSYRHCYSLPGGFVQRHESSEQAARRELREELGLDLSGCALRLAWSGTILFESRQDTVDIWETVAPETSAPTSLPLYPSGWEIIWTGWMTPAEALKMRLLPHIAAYLAQKPEIAGESA
ncbi:MAG: NUDIX hydrolase [Planctomycetes bacterium]|jgi:8-oxo-dGTP pyrophosphatase MutT (NUDIX family)|nr:NUDIX hydrolase [Planctomycetota bacterium]